MECMDIYMAMATALGHSMNCMVRPPIHTSGALRRIEKRGPLDPRLVLSHIETAVGRAYISYPDRGPPDPPTILWENGYIMHS